MAAMSVKEVCPKCGSSEVVPFVYGYPLEETFKEQDEGKIAFGGDVIDSTSPAWCCKTCQNVWGSYIEMRDRDQHLI
jgi:hypothetical protein